MNTDFIEKERTILKSITIKMKRYKLQMQL